MTRSFATIPGLQSSNLLFEISKVSYRYIESSLFPGMRMARSIIHFLAKIRPFLLAMRCVQTNEMLQFK